MKISKIFLTVVLFASSFIAYAQPGPPDDPDVPITGIEILIGIGSLFGASRFLKSKNKSKES